MHAILCTGEEETMIARVFVRVKFIGRIRVQHVCVRSRVEREETAKRITA